jgi:DNA-binding response OmpR family regulator
MPKQVLSVGQCAFDHAALCRLIEGRFNARVVPAATAGEAIAALAGQPFDLVLVNRVFDADGGLGLEFIRRVKSDGACSNVPLMLITNFPEHEAQAVAAGAVPGFGKRDLAGPAPLERLRPYLG